MNPAYNHIHNTLAVDKLEQIKKSIQTWMDKQGHDKCWYYPEIFAEIAQIVDIDLSTQNMNLPPIEEFKDGCHRYQIEMFKKQE